MDITSILKSLVKWLEVSGWRILLIVIFTLIAFKAVQIITSRFTNVFRKQKKFNDEYKKRADTLGSVIRHLLNVIIVGVAVMMILETIKIDIGPILAAAGIVGLAVGFGAQNLVKDFINGFFILLEDQIRVGDVVNIAGHAGLVEKVNLKMTILRDFSGNVHFVPNGNIDVVTNMTKDFSRYVFNIGVAYRENVDEVIEIIKLVGEELQQDEQFGSDIIAPIEVFGLDEFADSALVIKARITTKPIKQWGIAREFNRRLKIEFDKRNIEIPFPHVTVYAGQEKDGTAAPININMKQEK